jgi:hypothetical protein
LKDIDAVVTNQQPQGVPQLLKYRNFAERNPILLRFLLVVIGAYYRLKEVNVTKLFGNITDISSNTHKEGDRGYVR